MNARCAGLEPLGVERLDGVGGPATSASAVLVRLEVGEHVVGELAPVAALGPPHADAQPQELGRAEVLATERRPLWPPSAAAEPRLQPPELEVALVVDDEHRVRARP